MHWIKIMRLFWLCSSIATITIAQYSFTGIQTSEVSGNLTFYMLITSAPSSILACILMFPAINILQDFNLFPYNSRVALSAIWAVYFLLGLLQWFIIPLFWQRKKPNK